MIPSRLVSKQGCRILQQNNVHVMCLLCFVTVSRILLLLTFSSAGLWQCEKSCLKHLPILLVICLQLSALLVPACLLFLSALELEIKVQYEFSAYINIEANYTKSTGYQRTTPRRKWGAPGGTGGGRGRPTEIWIGQRCAASSTRRGQNPSRFQA